MEELMDVDWDCNLFYCVVRLGEELVASKEAVEKHSSAGCTGVMEGTSLSLAVRQVKEASGFESGGKVFGLRLQPSAWIDVTNVASSKECKKGMHLYFKVVPAQAQDDDERLKRQRLDDEKIEIMRIMLAQMESHWYSTTTVNSEHQVGDRIMNSSMWSKTLSEGELETYFGDPVMNVDSAIQKVLSGLGEASWDSLAMGGFVLYNEHAKQNQWKTLKLDDLQDKNGQPKEKCVQLAIWYFCCKVKELCPGVNWYAIDTSVSGIPGAGMKPDLSLCSVPYPSLAEMLTMLEFKNVHNLTNHASAVGQLKDRADKLFLNQPDRTKALMAYLAKDVLDLVIIEKTPLLVRHSGLFSLRFDEGSTGLRLFMRMLLTSKNFGFIPITPPFIPGTPRGGIITSLSLVYVAKPNKAVEEIDDVDTDQPSPRGTKVYFCKYEHLGIIKDAILKLGMMKKEIENLLAVKDTDGIIELLDYGSCPDGDYLITHPRGERLCLKMRAVDIISALSQIANTIKNLDGNHRMVHRDISIGNIIWVKETRKAYLIDWATAAEVEKVQAGDTITGTPLFLSIHVLQSEKSNVSTDLESLMYVLMYIASEGRLPWRAKTLDKNRFSTGISLKYCAMHNPKQFQKLAEKMTKDLDLKRVAENLRNLFFTPVYRTDVTPKEFLQALN